jgi:hypothetical protein
VGALPFEHEAKCRLRVTVGRGNLVWHDELYAGIERCRYLRLAAHARVFEDEHASWMAANQGWLARARRGPGRIGGPENTATAYFYNPVFNPYGRSGAAAG